MKCFSFGRVLFEIARDGDVGIHHRAGTTMAQTLPVHPIGLSAEARQRFGTGRTGLDVVLDPLPDCFSQLLGQQLV
jgi:hypothetical protein